MSLKRNVTVPTGRLAIGSIVYNNVKKAGELLVAEGITNHTGGNANRPRMALRGRRRSSRGRDGETSLRTGQVSTSEPGRSAAGVFEPQRRL
jgi:hypothetical protein